MGLRLSLLPGHLTQWYDSWLGSPEGCTHIERPPERGVYSEEKAWQATELWK